MITLQEKREELVVERDRGVEEFNKITQHLRQLQDTLLRIDGAIMVINEMLQADQPDAIPSEQE